MDFVVSYSSDQIDWFQRSVAMEEGYEDWYVWAVGEPNASAPHGYNYPSNWVSLTNTYQINRGKIKLIDK